MVDRHSQSIDYFFALDFFAFLFVPTEGVRLRSAHFDT
jgi:hypothetical protein